MMIKKQDETSCESIAIIKDGQYNNKIINFCPDDQNSKLEITDLFDHITDKEVRKTRKYMSLKDIMKVKRAFEYNQIDSDIIDIYDQLKPQVEHNIKSHIHIPDGTIQPIPLIQEGQTDRIFISGMSGSGKSTWIANYALSYNKLYKTNSIYMFSKKETDKAIDDIVDVKRIKINDDILEIDFDINDLSNSLCIFDDIDCFEKKIYDKIKNIRSSILELGRDKRIYMCNVSHQILNYKNTRDLILESNKIVFFPRSGQYQIKRFLKEYCGLDKDKINLIMNINSRWIQLNKTYPMTITGEHDIYII